MATVLDPKAFYQFEFPAGANVSSNLLRQYELKILIDGSHTVEIGRFSTGMINRLQVINKTTSSIIFRCGAFCEAAPDAQVIVGGEHSNKSISNIGFASLGDIYPMFLNDAERGAYHPGGSGALLGDNVLLSARATVLGGASIGTGTVLAAGAVASSACDELAIYGGVPAKKIKPRFEGDAAENYKKLDLPNIRGHCVHLIGQAVASLDGGISIDAVHIEHMKRRPALHISGSIGSDQRVKVAGITGYFMGDEKITSPKLLSELAAYFDQISKPSGSVRWSPDIFYALGIE